MSEASVVSRILHASLAEPRLLEAGRGSWWDQLDPQFYRRHEPFDLDRNDTGPIRATAMSDRVVRTFAALSVGSLALPLGFHPLKLKQLRREAEFYGAIAERGDVDAFFEPPVLGTKVKRRRARTMRFRPWDGDCEDLSFQSQFVPRNPDLRRTFRMHRRNRTAHARYWRHRHGPRPTIVAIHGFAAEGYLVNEWFFNLPWLYGMGCDVVLYTLPFHGPRQAVLSPFSGHGFFAGGMGRMNEAFAQGVHDFRVFLDHLLYERGVPSVGVTGVSLGGYTSALLAAVEPRLSFALPNVPVASLPDLVMEWQPMGAAIRGMMKASGVGLDELRRLSAVTCPLTWQPKLPKDRLMVIGGVGDRLAPPKHSRLIWDHWDRCRIHWFPGSHLLHLDRGAYLWQVARFLRGIGFLDADHPAPRRTQLVDGVELTQEVARS